MKPVDRETFKAFCLRKLGAPVVEINISDEQIDDAVDTALSYYGDYHFDASEKIYYKHLITPTDRTNKYITLPENIFGAVKVFRPGNVFGSGSDGLFNLQYQLALNELYTISGIQLVSYYITRTQLQLISELLIGEIPIRYSRHTNKLYIDMNWNSVKDGEYFLVEAYEIIDPNQFADIWKDRWLANYCSALIKQYWGTSLKKFTGVQLPGNIVINGQQIYNEATNEIKELEDDMIRSYSPVLPIFIG